MEAQTINPEVVVNDSKNIYGGYYGGGGGGGGSWYKWAVCGLKEKGRARRRVNNHPTYRRRVFMAAILPTNAQLSIISSSNWMCMDENIPVIPIPGPCAVVAALSASGFDTDEFAFGIYFSFQFLMLILRVGIFLMSC
ncbi:hypothetical protein SADUNF_Sadunf02G0025300 [Salix dunnii]|uniref:Uncharacterized protein n=1 Tax=Salix dunnii TaxID=1413687 RepID=A0A835N5R6_9ROSI|nr:hypothetical protein SADUNF_Sadunf02G0025300 [Salix dunnii]